MVMDFEDSVNVRVFVSVCPGGFEDDLDYVVAGVGLRELRDGVVERLVMFKILWLLEYFTARCAGEYVVAEREEEVAVGGDIGICGGRGDFFGGKRKGIWRVGLGWRVGE